ncbi:internal virion protein B [Pseudomonas phage PlaquesPlease]|uniref:Internal virion protein B n=1 Tax=Pseudomonas phage PlaquesPlease TaxID=2762289 RepID=A0A7G8LJV3_9CAUD|nr:internal virion protein B [Pseudomonas phage PlaquesPlease]
MCEPVSIAMASVALVGGVMSAKEKSKAEGAAEDAQRRTAREQVKQMNMANANLSLTAQDKAEEARSQLTETNMQALRNRGTIRTAIGESGLSGNSMRRIEQSVENEASQQRMSITDNYHRDYQSIFANQIANTENTKSAIKGQAQVIKTSGLSNALGIISSGANGYAMGSSIKGSSKSSSNGTPQGGN